MVHDLGMVTPDLTMHAVPILKELGLKVLDESKIVRSNEDTALPFRRPQGGDQRLISAPAAERGGDPTETVAEALLARIKQGAKNLYANKSLTAAGFVPRAVVR
jgi:hypothetical protein